MSSYHHVHFEDMMLFFYYFFHLTKNFGKIFLCYKGYFSVVMRYEGHKKTIMCSVK